jgi:hypothetical protein
MKRIRQSNKLLIHNKKWWLIGGAIGLSVFALAGLVGGSMYAWQQYEKEYVSWHKSLHDSADRVFALPITSAKQKTDKVTAFRNVYQLARQGEQHCHAYGFLHWQQFIAQVKSKINQCQQIKTNSESFLHDLTRVVDHLDSESQLMAGFSQVKAPAEYNEEAWKTSSAQWDKLVVYLGKQHVSASVEATRKLALQKATAVSDAWRVLIATSESKDKAKYEAAINQLSAAYDGLNEIARTAEASLKPLVDTLQKSYKRTLQTT